jgi:hypothetical protein
LPGRQCALKGCTCTLQEQRIHGIAQTFLGPEVMLDQTRRHSGL